MSYQTAGGSLLASYFRFLLMVRLKIFTKDNEENEGFPSKPKPMPLAVDWPRSVATNLAKPSSLERSCSHEIMGLGRKEPSFNHARHSHRPRCDCVRLNRAARANARGLLGCDRNIGRDAIHSRRDADALDRADRRYRGGCLSRSARGKLSRRKPRCVRGCNRPPRIALDHISSGEDCVSLCQHYPRHHRSDFAFGSGVDYRVTRVSW